MLDRAYQVEEVIDRWYGERVVYFKVRADDQNIYLLKYDEHQDDWDLVFYENPGKLREVRNFQGDVASLPAAYWGATSLRKAPILLN